MTSTNSAARAAVASARAAVSALWALVPATLVTDADHVAFENAEAAELDVDRAEAEAAEASLTPAQRAERDAAALVADAEMHALMPWLAPYVADFNARHGL